MLHNSTKKALLIIFVILTISLNNFITAVFILILSLLLIHVSVPCVNVRFINFSSTSNISLYPELFLSYPRMSLLIYYILFLLLLFWVSFIIVCYYHRLSLVIIYFYMYIMQFHISVV